MDNAVHLPYDVARILGSGLGVLPEQRTIKTECNRRVPIGGVSWVEPDCVECLASALAVCEMSIQILDEYADVGMPDRDRAVNELKRQRSFFRIRLERAQASR